MNIQSDSYRHRLVQVGDLRMWHYRATPGNPRQMRRRRPRSANDRTPPPAGYGSILFSRTLLLAVMEEGEAARGRRVGCRFGSGRPNSVGRAAGAAPPVAASDQPRDSRAQALEGDERVRAGASAQGGESQGSCGLRSGRARARPSAAGSRARSSSASARAGRAVPGSRSRAGLRASSRSRPPRLPAGDQPFPAPGLVVIADGMRNDDAEEGEAALDLLARRVRAADDRSREHREGSSDAPRGQDLLVAVRVFGLLLPIEQGRVSAAGSRRCLVSRSEAPQGGRKPCRRLRLPTSRVALRRATSPLCRGAPEGGQSATSGEGHGRNRCFRPKHGYAVGLIREPEAAKRQIRASGFFGLEFATCIERVALLRQGRASRLGLLSHARSGGCAWRPPLRVSSLRAPASSPSGQTVCFPLWRGPRAR
jgi:hypothetical protein